MEARVKPVQGLRFSILFIACGVLPNNLCINTSRNLFRWPLSTTGRLSSSSFFLQSGFSIASSNPSIIPWKLTIIVNNDETEYTRRSWPSRRCHELVSYGRNHFGSNHSDCYEMGCCPQDGLGRCCHAQCHRLLHRRTHCHILWGPLRPRPAHQSIDNVATHFTIQISLRCRSSLRPHHLPIQSYCRIAPTYPHVGSVPLAIGICCSSLH